MKSKRKPAQTRMVLLVMIAVFALAVLLINKQPYLQSGRAIEESKEQSTTSIGTINAFIDDDYRVNVITASHPYQLREVYTPYGQPIKKEYYAGGEKYYEVEYHYNNDPMSGIKTLLYSIDSLNIKQENLEFNYITDASLPALTKITIPLETGIQQLNNPVPEELVMYVHYEHEYIPHLQKILVNGWYGLSHQHAAQNSLTKNPDIHYLLDEKSSILVLPESTKNIEVTYMLRENKMLLASMKYLKNNQIFESISYTYDAQNRLKTETVKVDMNNDGILEENTNRDYIYNANNLLLEYKDTYKNGQTATYTLDWDRDDKYAALLGITGPQGPLIAGHTYGYEGLIPLSSGELFY